MKTLLNFLIVATFFIGCSHHEDPSPTTPPPTQNPPGASNDSLNVLKTVTTDQGLNLVFNYDAATGRCKSFGEVYPSRYDSVLIFYNSFGNIDRIVRKNGFYSQPLDYELTPSFFRYNAQQRLSHVFSKSMVSTITSSYPANYTTTLNNPYSYYEVPVYDSLVYDGLNRITECYTKYNASYSSPNITAYYSIMTYRPNGDSSLATGKKYNRNSSGGYDLTSYTFNTYAAQRNPYAENFSPAVLTAFCNVQGARFPMLPPYFSNYADRPFLQVSKNVCTTFMNTGLQTLNYQLNTQGLVSRVILGGASTDWTNFSYMKIKKP